MVIAASLWSLWRLRNKFCFQGAEMEKRELHSCKTKLLFAPVEGSLRRCSSNPAAKVYPSVGQATWRTDADSLEVRGGRGA